MAYILEIPELYNWMNRIKSMMRSFSRISFFHIYREQIQGVNHLSKQGFSYVPSVTDYSTYLSKKGALMFQV